jgi:hypothetical protein
MGQTLANLYREAPEHAGLGGGRHGFVFSLPPGLAFASHDRGAPLVRWRWSRLVSQCVAIAFRRPPAGSTPVRRHKAFTRTPEIIWEPARNNPSRAA